MNNSMTRADRDELVKLCRWREKLAKTGAAARAAQLKSEFEQQIAAIYEFDTDPIWKPAHDIAEAATARGQ